MYCEVVNSEIADMQYIYMGKFMQQILYQQECMNGFCEGWYEAVAVENTNFD